MDADLQKQLTKFACSTVAACANELEAAKIGSFIQQNEFNESTKKAAALKCANVQFKYRYADFLTDKKRVLSQADEYFFVHDQWH